MKKENNRLEVTIEVKDGDVTRYTYGCGIAFVILKEEEGEKYVSAQIHTKGTQEERFGVYCGMLKIIEDIEARDPDFKNILKEIGGIDGMLLEKVTS